MLSQSPHGAVRFKAKQYVVLHFLAALSRSRCYHYCFLLPVRCSQYYQKEISVLFNRKIQTADIFSAIQPSPISVIGQAKPDNGISISERQNLPFADVLPDDPNDVVKGSNHTTGNQNNPESELVSEVGNLIEAFKDVDNDRLGAISRLITNIN